MKDILDFASFVFMVMVAEPRGHFRRDDIADIKRYGLYCVPGYPPLIWIGR